MGRRALLWLLVVPASVAGSQIGHTLTYRLVTSPGGSSRAGSPDHGYLTYLPLALAACTALVAIALVGEVIAWRGRREGSVRAWQFAIVAPAVFALQEHFERVAHISDIATVPAIEPTFVVGLALQLPLAIVAWLLSRLLLRIAHDGARCLARQARLFAPTPLRLAVAASRERRVRVPALGYGVRGPPLNPAV